jgi:enamine deaminase RidA (YjgF/YER057c/UK114 family)
LAGCSLADVIKVNVWLDDTRDFWMFNKVYAGFFDNGKPPARSTVQSKLMIDAKIEVDVVAYSPGA